VDTGYDPLTRLVLLLFRAQQCISADGDRLASRWHLSSAKWKVLGAIALSDQALSAAAIGRNMGLSRQAALKQIDLLIAQGLLRRRPDPADARAPLHELTAKGRSRYQAVTAAWLKRSQSLSMGLDPAEFDRARELLAQLVARIEAEPAGTTLPSRGRRPGKP
jgi:DNA-binding MarR family transcriptional regulator